MEEVKFISAATVKEVLTWDDLVPAVQEGLASISRNAAEELVQPERSVIIVKENDGWFGVMPCYNKPDKILTTKMVAYFPHVGGDKSPMHALITVFRSDDGSPVAILDGSVITDMRTAAASVVATKFLARNTAGILTVIGTGHQARSHIEAMSHSFSFQEIRVVGRNAEKIDALISDMKAKNIVVLGYRDVQEAVSLADVIVTATSSSTPVLKKEWVKDGAHINGVGACRSEQQELDAELVRSCKIYVDKLSSALEEAGDIIQSKVVVQGEIGEVILGLKPQPTEHTTLFKSCGLAIEDLVSARIVCQKLGYL